MTVDAHDVNDANGCPVGFVPVSFIGGKSDSTCAIWCLCESVGQGSGTLTSYETPRGLDMLSNNSC